MEQVVDLAQIVVSYATFVKFHDGHSVDFKLIHFATPAEAEAMQRWIAESGIETRLAPPRYDGPQLTVAGAKAS